MRGGLTSQSELNPPRVRRAGRSRFPQRLPFTPVGANATQAAPQAASTCHAPARAVSANRGGATGAGGDEALSAERKTTPGARGGASGSTTCLATPSRYAISGPRSGPTYGRPHARTASRPPAARTASARSPASRHWYACSSRSAGRSAVRGAAAAATIAAAAAIAYGRADRAASAFAPSMSPTAPLIVISAAPGNAYRGSPENPASAMSATIAIQAAPAAAGTRAARKPREGGR